MFRYAGNNNSSMRLVGFEGPSGEVSAQIQGWSGFDDDISSVEVEGSVATITLDNGVSSRFELDTGSNTAREL